MMILRRRWGIKRERSETRLLRSGILIMGRGHGGRRRVP